MECTSSPFMVEQPKMTRSLCCSIKWRHSLSLCWLLVRMGRWVIAFVISLSFNFLSVKSDHLSNNLYHLLPQHSSYLWGTSRCHHGPPSIHHLHAITSHCIYTVCIQMILSCTSHYKLDPLLFRTPLCLAEIKNWMSHNFLKLKNSQSEVIIINPAATALAVSIFPLVSVPSLSTSAMGTLARVSSLIPT